MCLKKLGIDLTTVDLAPQRAQELIREHSLQVVRCDIEREPLPFEDQSVATIALCATFEHLRVDPLFALEEMRRVLQPDGLLYLTTPNLYRLGNVVSFALGRGLAFDPIREYGKIRTVGHMGHVREYTASEIREFLAEAGFVAVEVRTRATPSRRGKLVDAVHQLLPRIRAELVVTARARSGFFQLVANVRVRYGAARATSPRVPSRALGRAPFGGQRLGSRHVRVTYHRYGAGVGQALHSTRVWIITVERLDLLPPTRGLVSS